MLLIQQLPLLNARHRLQAPPDTRFSGARGEVFPVVAAKIF